MNQPTTEDAAPRITALEQALADTRRTIEHGATIQSETFGEIAGRLSTLQERVDALEAKARSLENPPVTLQARRANGEMEGLTPGWPFWLPAGDRHADYQGLAGDDCPRCGHHGLSPRYWYRAEPRAIASFAECPACRHSEPF